MLFSTVKLVELFFNHSGHTLPTIFQEICITACFSATFVYPFRVPDGYYSAVFTLFVLNCNGQLSMVSNKTKLAVVIVALEVKHGIERKGI